MELDLQEDLKEALEGIDPLDILNEDQNLAEVAEELWSFPVTDTPENATASDTKNKHQTSGNITPELNVTLTSSSKSCKTKLEKSGSKSGENVFQVVCRVCHNPANGHLHYGAAVCTSCRAFFSRAIQKENFKAFVCTNLTQEGKCHVDSKSKRKCKKCRFSKCLSIGMKVPTTHGQGTVEYYKQSHGCVRHLKGALSFSDNLSSEERLLIRDLMIKRFHAYMERRAKFIISDLSIYREALGSHYEGQTFSSLSTYKAYEDFVIYGQVQALLDGEITDNLTQKDRARLLTHNFALTHEFLEAHKFGIVSRRDIDFSRHIARLLDKLDPDEKKTFNDIRDKFSKSGQMEPKKLRYESIFDPKLMAIPAGEPVTRHRQLVEKVSTLTRPGDSDPILMTLMLSIIMYTPDFLDLDHPEKAEKVQMTFASLLHRYLRSKRTPRRDWLFCECMMASTYARELRGFREAAYKKNLRRV